MTKINSNFLKIQKEILIEKLKFSNDYENLLIGKKDFVYSNKVVKAKPVDLLRTVIETNRNGFVFLMLRNLLINSFVSLENKSVASGLSLFHNLFVESPDEVKVKRKLSNKDLNLALKSYLGDGIIHETCLNIFENVGHDATIGFDIAHSDNKLTVKLKPSFPINGYMHELFQTKKFKIFNSKIICVNGIVESISNIENLINSAFKTKEPLLIIAKGFGADLVNTLNYNYNKNNYNIFPFVATNEEDIQELKNKNIDFIDLENSLLLNSIKLDDLKFDYDFLIDFNKIEINTNLEETNKIVEVLIPKKYMPLSGLIEDRMLSGLSFCKAATFSGLVELPNKLFLPFSSYKIGKLSKTTLDNQLNNLSSIIYTD